MFALPISKPRFKSIIFFYQNSPKINLFLQKKAEFSRAGGSPPDPRASGGWGLCPQTPSLRRLGAKPSHPQNSSPIANSWLRACLGRNDLLILPIFCQFGPSEGWAPPEVHKRVLKFNQTATCQIQSSRALDGFIRLLM